MHMWGAQLSVPQLFCNLILSFFIKKISNNSKLWITSQSESSQSPLLHQLDSQFPVQKATNSIVSSGQNAIYLKRRLIPQRRY